MKIAILKNEDPFDHTPWINACERISEGLVHTVIDLTREDWLENIKQFEPDVCLLKPSGKTSLFRQLYQERVEIIARDLSINVYPSYDELRIYESKRYFAYWAKASGIPHPRTWVFYTKEEAIGFARSCSYPVVTKLNIGASGNGVVIIKSQSHLESYIEQAFSTGIAPKTGPKLGKGKLIQRAWRMLVNPKLLINRLNTYAKIAADKQFGFVIIQEFIPHNFEWRAVRIGDSFFAHKKLKLGDKASGSLLKNYDNPPIKVFDFVKEITDRFGFRSVAVDFFEDQKGVYIINEIQCIFGQSDSYQMLVDGTPGRYRLIGGKWIFEEGDFNANQSYNLRLDYIFNKE